MAFCVAMCWEMFAIAGFLCRGKIIHYGPFLSHHHILQQSRNGNLAGNTMVALTQNIRGLPLLLPIISISLGVAVCIPSEQASVAALIADAGAALYRAKKAGRNRVYN